MKSNNDDVRRVVPLCTLGLPPLSPHASIIRLGCRAEPNPTGSGSLLIPAPSSRPFRDKAADVIVLFNLLIEDTNMHAAQFFHETRPFTFFIHRRALLVQIPHAQRAWAPFCSAPGATARTLVPWSARGISATRWFEFDPASMCWITTTA